MKKFKSLFAVTVLGISTVFISASAYAFLNVIPMDIAEKSLVQVVVPANNNTSVYVSDSRGELVHSDNIEAGKINSKVYDFSNMREGIYTFYSETDFTNVTKKIMLDESGIEIISKEVDFKPVFLVNDGKLKINFLNSDQKEIEMQVESADRNFYDAKEGNPVSFQKKFDISQMPRGEYYAVLSVDGRNYYHFFRVD